MNYKILKNLFIGSSIIVAPLMASSCSNGNPSSAINWSTLTPASQVNPKPDPINPSTKTIGMYVSALATALKAQLGTPALKTAVSATAKSSTDNTVDISTYIAKAITTAKAAVTKVGLDSKIIDNIKLIFESSKNIHVTQVAKKYTLTAFPAFIMSASDTSSLSTTLDLSFGKDKATQTITNSFTITKGFRNYSATSGLGNNDINSTFVSTDGTIYAATDGGLSVSVQKGNNYTFKNYTESDGLNSNQINDIYVTPGGKYIYVATPNGVSLGTRAKATDPYTFTNSTNSSGGFGYVNAIYVIPDKTNIENTKIYAATFTNGIVLGDVFKGLPQRQEAYNMGNSPALRSNNIFDLTVVGTTIYTATGDGIAVGTSSSFPSGYTFVNHTDSLPAKKIESVAISADSKTIYAATDKGLGIGTIGVFSFTNYLDSDKTTSIAASSNEKVYVGTGKGLSAGTKVSKNNYSFTNFTKVKNGLGSDSVNGVSVSSKGDAVYAATQAGLSISKTSWFNSTSNFINPQVTNFRQD